MMRFWLLRNCATLALVDWLFFEVQMSLLGPNWISVNFAYCFRLDESGVVVSPGPIYFVCVTVVGY